MELYHFFSLTHIAMLPVVKAYCSALALCHSCRLRLNHLPEWAVFICIVNRVMTDAVQGYGLCQRVRIGQKRLVFSTKILGMHPATPLCFDQDYMDSDSRVSSWAKRRALLQCFQSSYR